MPYPRLASFLVVLAALAALGCGAPVQTGGLVAADGRAFAQDPKYPGQARGDAVSLVAEPEVSVKTEDGTHEAAVRPFYRLDPIDDRRSHADLRKAYYQLATGPFEAGLGVRTFTWGVLESYRPTDVMNQIDFVESWSGSAKLGQPYVQLGWVGESAALRVYYLPYFRERNFPGVRGRLRFPAVIDVDHPSYESSLGPWYPTTAARFSLELGKIDFGVSALSGVSREPRFFAELTAGSVFPRYDLMHQGSVDAQWTVGSFVLKGEGFVRAWSSDLRVFGGGGIGADYTFAQVGGDADVTLVAEGLFDTRPMDAPPTFFRHDAFLGTRVAFGDTSSTEVLMGAIVDVVDGTTFGRADVARHLGDHWRVSADVDLFLGPTGRLASAFVRDDHVHGRIAYFF